MKKLKLIPLAVSLSAIILTIVSCKKSEDKIQHFTWTYGGSNYVATFYHADLPFTYDTAYSITGYNQGTSVHAIIGPRMSLPSFQPGTYSLDSTSLVYYDNFLLPDHTTGGTITITSSSDNLLSGNFSGTIINTVNQPVSITGTFVDVPITH